MSHYEERLLRDLNWIRDEISDMGLEVRTALSDSVKALMTGDHDLAYQTVLHDQVVNRRVEALDKRCHAFVARHLPSAGHLRFISSVLRINLAVERIGDYAVTICREAVRLAEAPPELVRQDLGLFAQHADALLGRAFEALRTSDPELARGLKVGGTKISTIYDRASENLVLEAEKSGHEITDLFSYLVIFGRLGRACDQAKNICEEVVFSATGEVKKPKVFRILFLDETNSCSALIAVACARRLFGDSATFASAGLNPEVGSSPGFDDFMRSQSYPLEAPRPEEAVELTPEGVAKFHLIIGLQSGLLQKIGAVPHRVVELTWSIPSCAELTDSGQSPKDAFATVHNCIEKELKNLKEVLIGEGPVQDGE